MPLQRTDDGKADLYKAAADVKVPDEETLEKWRALVGGALVGAGKVIIGEETSKVKTLSRFKVYADHLSNSTSRTISSASGR